MMYVMYFFYRRLSLNFTLIHILFIEIEIHTMPKRKILPTKTSLLTKLSTNTIELNCVNEIGIRIMDQCKLRIWIWRTLFRIRNFFHKKFYGLPSSTILFFHIFLYYFFSIFRVRKFSADIIR